MREKPPCELCREKHDNRGEMTPCSDCINLLLPENEEAYSVYAICASQVMRAGMDGTIVGLRLEAVESAMRIYGVNDKVKCALKVMKIFDELRDGPITR